MSEEPPLDSESEIESLTLGTLAGAAARGGVEAACLATFLIPLVGLLSSQADSVQLLAAWVGLVLGGALFALGPAAWRGTRSGGGKRLVLLISSFFAVMGVALPLQLAGRGADSDSFVLAFGLAIGAALGLGQAIAGIPFSMIPWRDGSLSLQNPLPRAAMIVTYASLVALVPFSVIFFGLLGVPAEKLANLGMLVVYVFPILTLLRLVLAPLAESSAKKLLEKKKPISSHADAVLAWRQALGLAAQAVDPDARRKFLEVALENARIAYALSLTVPTIQELSDDRRRYVELIFLLGKTDEIETALARFCESPVLEAELARLRGQPERAIELARSAADASDTNATDRANAQSVLALAEAELGRYEEARARLEAIARAQKMVKPLVPRFTASSISVEIARLESGGKRSSPRARTANEA